jgi:UDP-glucose 4-epimerase
MNYLETGGAGFIGSHLAEALLARGDRVMVLDDLSTGSVENIRHLRSKPSLHCFFESVMDRRLLAELVDESDIVFHLAAAAGVRRIIESPVRTIETNVKGTELVLEAAAKKNKLVFLAPTSEVYGKNGKAPSEKTTIPCTARPPSRGGRTLVPRPSMSFSPWPTGRKENCPS